MGKRKQPPEPDENAPPPRPCPNPRGEKLLAQMDESDEMRKLLSADQRGRMDRLALTRPRLDLPPHEELQLIRDQKATVRELAQARDGSRGQAQKNRQHWLRRDEADLVKVVELLNKGEVNKTIASKLKIALVRVKRLRATAKERGLLNRRRR